MGGSLGHTYLKRRPVKSLHFAEKNRRRRRKKALPLPKGEGDIYNS
jgi:hypothetical protein